MFLIKNSPYSLFLEQAIAASQRAAELVLSFYQKQNFQTVFKNNHLGPLTSADLISNQVICDYLSAHSSFPILSEETKDDLSRLAAQYVWIVDPLDGTKEFLSRRPEFSINVALVYEKKPIVGVIADPVSGSIYFAGQNMGAFLFSKNTLKSLHVSEKSELDSLNIAVSRSHSHPALIEALARLKNLNIQKNGSALKYCYVASGKIDASLRKTPLHEWDVAAADCILHEAHGKLTDIFGVPLTYNNKDTLVNSGLIASNARLHQYFVDMFNQN